MVLGETSLTETPPEVMIASSMGRKPVGQTRKHLKHEISARRSSRVIECTFLYGSMPLASTTSGQAAYEYSGWLKGYIHLGNALYRVDPNTYWAIRDQLPDTVKADLAYNNAYWDQFRDTVVQTVSTKVYDGVLKAYGDERGIQSYGTVVDMLVAYYNAY